MNEQFLVPTLSLICASSDSADRPAIPATAPLAGRLVPMIYSGSDGRQYIVTACRKPGQLELTQAFDAHDAVSGLGLRDLIPS